MQRERNIMAAAEGWRARSGTSFTCEKQPASAHRGMVVTNHPLASAAAIEIMAAGGNAVDAAITALFALSVVEPMMVGLLGGGTALIHRASGEQVVIDGLSTAPAAARPDSYVPVSDHWPDYMETEGRANAIGPRSVAVPGNLKAWCETLSRFGTLPLEAVMAPSIRLAATGFRVTSYLSACIDSVGADMLRDPALAARFMPDGQPLAAGALLVQPDTAETLRAIASEGPGLLYGGALGTQITAELQRAGSLLAAEDLNAYRTITRAPVRGTYRGVEIVGPPPPCSGGVHIVQMLNVLEGFDVAGAGFGTAAGLHLILEAMKIAAADRNAATADPDFVDVPVARLLSKSYAALRRAEIDPARVGVFPSRVLSNESANTTHVTVADDRGNIVSSTQTINSLFGARLIIGGTGLIANNYMYLFDPHPGHALSLAPGKRITSTQSPLIAFREGKPVFALGLPGGPRLYGSALQAVVNLIDHGMSLQEAVEAPRVWTQGQDAEIEDCVPESIRDALLRLGHPVVPVRHIAGGMCAVRFEPEGGMTGAACWRADGTPIGLAGGPARDGVRFWPDQRRR
jgi:gamma-glutamyltranspeptidase / glutathione hydrolase